MYKESRNRSLRNYIIKTLDIILNSLLNSKINFEFTKVELNI